MQHLKRILLALLLVSGVSSPAFAANAVGNGGSLGPLSCVYNTALPTLTTGQTSVVQCDSIGRVISAPASLIFASPFQTYPATGVGADTVFPSSVSTSGTSLGTPPSGASRILIHLPPGSSVTLYVAPTVAANATAAALVSVAYANASGATSNLDVPLDLNGQFVWVTNYTSGTAGTYISGKPVYRFI